ncbi:isochorismatase family protein [Pararhizobium sp.]|uniref:isochorismatase family protein n=1 Tax=Pararhizobium sp. TaxID=1977563 RepID=UPI003D097314
MEQSESVEATADALIVVDVQVAFVIGIEAVPDHVKLLKAVETLITSARAAKVPVVFLQNDGEPGAADEPHQPGWKLHFPALSGESVVRKAADDGFDGTSLNDLLVASAVQTVALCGVLSEMCVAATARAAMQRGYDLILPHDGHATYDVPPGPGGSAKVPASMAARAAEWSLGDGITIPASVVDVRFSRLTEK